MPDDQDTDSDGSYRWSYRKNGNLAAMTDVVGYIPGAGMIVSALGAAKAVNGAASAADSASGKLRVTRSITVNI